MSPIHLGEIPNLEWSVAHHGAGHALIQGRICSEIVTAELAEESAPGLKRKRPAAVPVPLRIILRRRQLLPPWFWFGENNQVPWFERVT